MELYNRVVLRAAIKGLAAEGQRSRKFICRTTKEVKSGHWYFKRRIGVMTRLHLLAYAFLEGRQYRTVEPYTDLSSGDSLANLAEPLLNIVNRYSEWKKGSRNVFESGRGYVHVYNLDEVVAWLNQPMAAPRPPRIKPPYDPSRVARKKEEK